MCPVEKEDPLAHIAAASDGAQGRWTSEAPEDAGAAVPAERSPPRASLHGPVYGASSAKTPRFLLLGADALLANHLAPACMLGAHKSTEMLWRAADRLRAERG